MPFGTDPLEDGDAANAASVNDRTDDYETWVNALRRNAFRKGAFGLAQADSIFWASNPQTVSSEGQQQTYNQAVFTNGYRWTGFGNNGGVGSADAVGAAGDRVVAGHPGCPGYTGSAAEITIAPANSRVGMSRDKISAFLVLWNVQLVVVDTNARAVTGTAFVTCIQYKHSGSATWYTLEETESFVSTDDHRTTSGTDAQYMDNDVAVATLITPAVLTRDGANLATDEVTNVRAMVTMYDPAGPTANIGFTIHRWNLSVAPLFTSDP